MANAVHRYLKKSILWMVSSAFNEVEVVTPPFTSHNVIVCGQCMLVTSLEGGQD